MCLTVFHARPALNFVARKVLNPFALDVGKASLAEYGHEVHIENISIVFLRRVLQSGQHHRYPILCDEISVASLGLGPIRAAVNWVSVV